MTKWQKRVTVLRAGLSLMTRALAASSYVVFAWFTQNRTATVTYESVSVVGDSLTAELLSWKKNYESNYGSGKSTAGYLPYDGTNSQTESNLSYSYSDFQKIAVDGSDPEPSAPRSPAYVKSYCLKVTSSSTRSQNFIFASSSLSYSASSIQVLKEGSKSETLVSLFDVEHCYLYQASSETEEGIAAFLKNPAANHQGEVSLNKPTDFSSGEHAELSLTENWSSASPKASSDGSIRIASGESVYLFLSFVFSNDSSTFYREESDADGTYYVADATNGDSNVYQGLKLSYQDFSVIGV